MPKLKTTPDEWIKNFPELKIENNKNFCRACLKTIQSDRKFNVFQHVKTALHVERKKKLQTAKNKQQTIQECVASSSSHDEQFKFNFELCKMIESNIPLKKLHNSPLKKFLNTYCNRHIPEESTLRKNYVEPVYRQVMDEIRTLIGENFIWFSVDETTDSCGRYVASLIIGILNEDTPTRGFLVQCKELPKTNSNTITRFVNESLTKFFLPKAVPQEKILLMISDAAAYMIKAGANLKIFYEKLIHVTCLAHGLNRVAETIRLEFPIVNKLIKNGKKMFIKAPLRVQHFKQKLPHVPLPPEPILTRWGTWLEAALYYSEHLEGFEEVVTEFSDTPSQSIQDCLNVLQHKDLRQHLAFIKAHYGFVSKTITKLEKQGVPLVESTSIITEFKEAIMAVQGPIGRKVIKKLNEVLDKNKGYNVLFNVARVLQGDFLEDLEVEHSIIPKLKFAPITSVDVERSFSDLKNILSDRRRNLTIEHLEQHIIIYCFNNNSNSE